MKKLFVHFFLLLASPLVIGDFHVLAMDERNIRNNTGKRLHNEITHEENIPLFPKLKKMKLSKIEPIKTINLTTLPYDCMSLIMDYLSFQDLGQLFVSCRSLNNAVLGKMREFRSINSPNQSRNLEISSSYRRVGGMEVILKEIDMFRFISKYTLPDLITTADISTFSYLCLPFLKEMALTSLTINLSDKTEYISDLKHFPRLTKLNLCYVDIEDATLDGLEELSSLTSLTLHSCHPSENPTNHTDISAIQNLPNLKELILFEAWFATNFSDLKFNSLETLIIEESAPNYDETTNFSVIYDNIPTLQYFRTKSGREPEHIWR